MGTDGYGGMVALVDQTEHLSLSLRTTVDVGHNGSLPISDLQEEELMEFSMEIREEPEPLSHIKLSH